MPLLYRILMRLAALAAVIGGGGGILITISNTQALGPSWPLFIVIALIPAAILYAPRRSS
ncbi:MAG: hypothetical protein HIU85_19350 [Proteobacteria bacterium]|nr:hypothetical protein [Pseudomonadota bacterium]